MADLLPREKHPTIDVAGRQLRAIADQGLGAIIAANDPPTLFVRGGEPVQVVEDEDEISHLRRVGLHVMRSIASEAADWLKGAKPCSPPDVVIEEILTRIPWPGLKPLRTIAQCPILGPDWTLRTECGYHESARVYITNHIRTIEASTEQAKSIVLDDLLGDFPFADQASRAAAVALFLQPFVRPAIQGPTPLTFFEAPSSRTGKSKAIRTILAAGIGRVPTTDFSRDNEALRKTLTSVLIAGQSVIFFDNIRGKFSSPLLENLLTAIDWTDRRLGVSETVTVRNDVVWAGTGNNCEVSTDMFGRISFGRLDALCEFPGERTGPEPGRDWRHANIEQWALTHRGLLWGAAIRMIQNWLDANRPMGTTHAIGGYDDWEGILGGILGVAGIDGFLSNRERTRARVAAEDEEWISLVGAWADEWGVQQIEVSWIIDKFGDTDIVSDIVGPAKERGKSLGKHIGNHRGRIYAGWQIQGMDAGQKNKRGFREFWLADPADPFA